MVLGFRVSRVLGLRFRLRGLESGSWVAEGFWLRDRLFEILGVGFGSGSSVCLSGFIW